ncbi:MAG TPA: cell surface protein [Opitutales bacterium]|nr:cell surface protein [Opitutales bacterium]
MNTRQLFKITLASAVLALGGCQHFVENTTPVKIPANASDLYTFTVKVDENQRKIVPKTLWVEMVINGETVKMHRDRDGKYVWTCDYPVPSNVSDVPYYFIIHFISENDGNQVKEIVYSTDETGSSKPHKSIITNRYVIRVASSRSPVGAMIPVVGQGFSPSDTIIVGDVEARTTIVSRNNLNFIVPYLPAGASYEVKLHTQDGDISAGRLRIDNSTIGVQPNALTLKQGESFPVTFFIDIPAPTGGLTIDIQTDIPASVVMPVVVIPEGQRSVSVTVQAGQPGQGVLILKTPGYEIAKIPVTVE